MDYGLPKSVIVNDKEVKIRYDFRVMMDIFEVFSMDDLTQAEQVTVALSYFYPNFPNLPDYPRFEHSIEAMFIFINGGKKQKETGKKQPQLVSWKDDYLYICSAVNHVLGMEVRGVEYDKENNTGGLHWWTFLGAYMEIGDCFFSQVVGIRSKKAKGKKLDKHDEEFYRANKDIIETLNKTTVTENEWLKTIL